MQKPFKEFYFYSLTAFTQRTTNVTCKGKAAKLLLAVAQGSIKHTEQQAGIKRIMHMDYKKINPTTQLYIRRASLKII